MDLQVEKANGVENTGHDVLTSSLASMYFFLISAHCVPRPSCEAWNYKQVHIRIMSFLKLEPSLTIKFVYCPPGIS